MCALIFHKGIVVLILVEISINTIVDMLNDSEISSIVQGAALDISIGTVKKY